jgi:DNA topoisomerase-1
MDRISEGNISEESVLEESRQMLNSIFGEMQENEEQISESLREGLRKDKIIGKCPECGSELMIRRSKKGSRFIGCNGYPDCNFSLPLPKSGTIIVTDKKCETHGIYHIKVNTGKRRAWELGCAYCNYLEWKASSAAENNGKLKPKNITDIPGIGKVTAEKLNAAGVTTVEELGEGNAGEIAKSTNIPVGKIIRWQEVIT